MPRGLTKHRFGPEAYYIFSREHSAFWRPNGQGYTPDIEQAGFYSRDEALKFCAEALGGIAGGACPNEVPVRVDDAREMYERAGE